MPAVGNGAKSGPDFLQSANNSSLAAAKMRGFQRAGVLSNRRLLVGWQAVSQGLKQINKK